IRLLRLLSPAFQKRNPEFQLLDPDPSMPRARVARGRFAQGRSGNPRSRSPGVRNPKRRIPDLAARPLSASASADLLDRESHLLRGRAAKLLPPPPAAISRRVRAWSRWVRRLARAGSVSQNREK